MAITNFYLIAGGAGSADINAGSSIGAAQATPTTGGSWTNATNTYVATGGTPFGTTIVGDYVSVYADGATVTGYVAQVTNVVSNVSVVLSATIKYGTAPTDGAANRSAVAGGSWNTEQVLAAGGLATFTVPQSTKINIKGNVTIAASRVVSMAGSATLILWFSAYNTTPGDLDNDTTNSLTKPIWTLNSTFFLTSSGGSQLWSGLSIVGVRSGTVWTVTGSRTQLTRCRSENTSSNAAAIALNCSSTILAAYCWFKCPTTATTSGTVTPGASGILIGCISEGGGLAGFNCGSSVVTLINCIGLNNTGAAFLSTTGSLLISYSTAYSPTVDGIKWSGAPASTFQSFVVGTLVTSSSGGSAVTNGINNASGTNTNLIFRACNDYSNVTNPEVGLGDHPAWFGQTDSSFPLTGSTDMTPLTTSNAYKNGFPKVFEGGGALGAQVNGGLSIGAVQPTPGSGSGVSGIIGDGSSW